MFLADFAIDFSRDSAVFVQIRNALIKVPLQACFRCKMRVRTAQFATRWASLLIWHAKRSSAAFCGGSGVKYGFGRHKLRQSSRRNPSRLKVTVKPVGMRASMERFNALPWVRYPPNLDENRPKSPDLWGIRSIRAADIGLQSRQINHHR
jgi:hypothetical protein